MIAAVGGGQAAGEAAGDQARLDMGVDVAGRESVLAERLPMPDFHLITGIENVPLEGLAVTGRHRGFPNGVLRPCQETLCLPCTAPKCHDQSDLTLWGPGVRPDPLSCSAR